MGLREDIWDTVTIRDALQMANRYRVFVELTFRDEEGKELVIPFNLITYVGTRKFGFKPSILEEYEAPISRVVRVVPKSEDLR
jgi:hypothetical protein